MLGWRLINTMEADFCVDAWEAALRVGRQAPLISNTDQGSQFTSPMFIDAVESAEQEAGARHTTLPDVVTQQLRIMAHNWRNSRAGKTPVTDALRGAVKLPPDFDDKAVLTEELQKKHGVQG